MNACFCWLQLVAVFFSFHLEFVLIEFLNLHENELMRAGPATDPVSDDDDEVGAPYIYIFNGAGG